MNTTTSYIIGFALSILLTLLAFGGMVMHIASGHLFPTHQMLTVGFVILAILQLAVQLFFFLHVGKGQNRHWNAVVLGFAFFIVSVLVGGTLWIMHNLIANEVHNSPYINNQITVVNEND